MTQQSASGALAVLPVSRTKAEAKRFYGRISLIYGWMTGAFERKHGGYALKLLSIRNRETPLEIGTGSGYGFQRMASLVGVGGKCCGVDTSVGMLRATRKRSNRKLRPALVCIALMPPGCPSVRIPLTLF